MLHSEIEFTSTITVARIGGFGSDMDIVSAARVDPEIPDEALTLKDDNLLEFLLQERHGTPFEHAAIKFYVEAPIFVSREHFRHRIGHSYNEFSTRYKRVGSEANPMRVYIPPVGDIRTQVGTPGKYTFEPVKQSLAEITQTNLKQAAADAYRYYTHLLDNGIAKEVARNVLPLSTMTKYVWTCNPRSLMHFLGLRTAAQALTEIRNVAQQAELVFAEQFPKTHEYFVKHGSKCP